MTVVRSCARCRTVLISGQQGCVRCGLTAAEPTRSAPPVDVRGLLGRVTVAWTGYGGVKHESDLLFHITGQAA